MLSYKIAVSLISGTVCAYLAHRGKKNPYLWFVIGAAFGIFGIFFLFFMPKSKPKAQEEPIKTIDITPTVPPENQTPFWYYLTPDNTQQGPISFEGLKAAWKEGKVSPQTYVWNETLKEWVPFSQFLPS